MKTASTFDQLNSTLAGRYQVEQEIGRGGMATVYLARDLRHDRRVALKLLLAELGAILGPERFLSEIRVTANLQHPNLLPLFDSGEAGGRLYYVMPYVEGESLRHRLNREKQIPVDEAVRIVTACASALHYAHEHHVVHRDLKPENILLSAGHPVIADFGIALAVSNAGGARITQSGLSLGTPQYMSPEQAAGDREVDGRSDVYSLACVLYEMLTGDPPHTGSTVQAVIAKVLVEKPRSVRDQRDRVPVHVDAAIERALAKIPADRWATAGGFGQALVDPALTRDSEALSSRRISWSRGGGRPRWLWALWPAITALAVISAAVAWWGRASSRPSAPVAFVVYPAQNARLATDPSNVLFAPDGRSIVYAAFVGGRRKLFIRHLGSLSGREITGSDDARSPFISPDGKWVAFGTENNTIYRVPVAGGTPVEIARLKGFWGGAWSPRGDIVVGADSGLYAITLSAAPPKVVTRVDEKRDELVHALPLFLPDHKTIVFRIEDRLTRANNRLGVATLDREGHALLGITGGNPLAFHEGRLVFGKVGGFIAAVALDRDWRKAVGEPAVLLDEVSVYSGAAASFASDGSLVYVKSSNASRFLLADDRGAPARATDDSGRRYYSPRLSPDGTRIAVQVSSAGTSRSDIWVYDISSHVLTRLTSQGPSERAEWTPDGQHLVYLRHQNGKWDVWRVAADGSGSEEKLFGLERSIRGVSFSPDSRFAALQVDDPATNRDIMVVSFDTSGKVIGSSKLLGSAFNELGPRVSPDGRWLAYLSDESGRHEVYVRAFPGTGPRVQVSMNGGGEPVWADESRLIYRTRDKFVMAALNTKTGLGVISRQELFDDRYVSMLDRAQFDVDRSGKSFVLLQPVGTPEVVVMLNALDSLLASAARAR